ncbi:MAG: putative amidohydrolase YtcJ [Polaribacter sp.]|jgi:predicted amidohydrolase YtcJ
MRLINNNLTILLLLSPIYFVTNSFASCKIITNIQGTTATSSSKELQSFKWLVFDEGRVVETSNNSKRSNFTHCQNIDGHGASLLPGLIDAHGHVSGLGNEMLRVKLRGITSESLAIKQVEQFALENTKSKWILGRGWNQVLWLNKQFPTKQSLDSTGIKRPIVLRRVDGHAAWVNSRALKIAGINSKTVDPHGGKIERDNNGDATGLLIDNAIDLVENMIPQTSFLEQDYAFDKAFEHLLSLGITSVHDAGVSQLDFDIYRTRVKENRMPLRIYGMLNGAGKNLNSWLKNGIVSDDLDLLLIRSVKLYSDGALGSRGAALLKPYSDDVDNKGLLLTKPKELDNLVEKILSKGFQVNVHAIGDRGNRLVLDAFEKTYKKVGGRELRNRIEHSQIVSLIDISRFKTLDMIASIQPVFATSDKNMAGDRLGYERLKGAYAWNKFLQQGTVIASGSDFPVELANPFHGLHAAVTRQDHNNQPEGGWLPGEKITLTQALRSFTLNAAYAAHQEKTLGSLEKGKWADFILIDKDVINGDPKEIWKTQVLQTWIAGKLVFKR